MRKLFWQRWALIFLLVGRLVIGELGHAMPMAHAPDRGSGQHHSVSLQHAAAAAPAGCAEHAGSAGEHSAAHHGGGAAG
ncbi:MAG: hypothetical protein SXG53_26170, partial [Pseudomonadota bacterium]|nr:hypothetical protein [Pseudomonadota bacterium]